MINAPVSKTTIVPPSIDWWITSRCNLACDFCYGPVPTSDPQNLQSIISDRIAESAAAAVTFCGGEPLTIGRALLEFAHQQRRSGKRVVLNTNGELFDRVFQPDDELPFDVVGISIDGATPDSHREMRGTEARLDRTIATARYVSEKGITLKIATVISAVNVNRISEIAALVRDLEPAAWRLYEYSPRGPQNSGRDRHAISRSAFNEAVLEAAEQAGSVPTFPADTDSNRGCFIVDPEGFVLAPGDENYERLGNCILTPIDNIWRVHPGAHTIALNKSWIENLR